MTDDRFLLKDFFNRETIGTIGDAGADAYPEFDRAQFLDSVFDGDWHDRELKERMRHTAACLRTSLPEEYRSALGILVAAALAAKEAGFAAMAFSDFVEAYGIDDFEPSVSALEVFTRNVSEEFAVRPFLVRFPDRMLRVSNMNDIVSDSFSGSRSDVVALIQASRSGPCGHAARLEALLLGVIHAVQDAHEHRHDVLVVPGRPERVLPQQPTVGGDGEVDVGHAFVGRRRRQHREDGRVGMVEANRPDDDVERVEVVFVGGLRTRCQTRTGTRYRVASPPSARFEATRADIGFGHVTGITILYALLVSVIVVPPLLVVWAAYHQWRSEAQAVRPPAAAAAKATA